jgi:hypothetical protein
MSLKLQLHDRVWIVSNGKGSVAEIHLDYWGQVGEVVLYADTSHDIQLQVLRLAASHVQKFVRKRTGYGMGDLIDVRSGDINLTIFQSHSLMDFAYIPEAIQKLDRETIVRELHLLQVHVVIAVHKTVEEAVDAALFRVGVVGLRYSVIRQQSIFDKEIALQFSVNKPDRFIFWKRESIPIGQGWDLHVVPHYHPVMSGWKAIGMVNGTTDAYIGGNAVRSICCPKAAQSDRHGRNFGSSWGRMKHPFYATGRSMGIGLTKTKVRSKEGVEELTELLRASLGLKKQYVEISGGFRAPLKCAHNRLLEINRRSPYLKAKYSRDGHVARGSEEHCVWAYRTLTDEGVIEKSHVPAWLLSEGWLEIYEGAEVSRMMY